MAEKSGAGLRALVAGACIAIIAGAGYYLIGEYRSSQRAKEAALQQQLDETMRQACLDDLSTSFSIDSSAPHKIANCLYKAI